jgi:threonine dehydratase
MFPIAAHVQAVLLVSDEAIQYAQKTLWKALRVVAEPRRGGLHGASQRYQPRPGERAGVLVYGGNTTAVDFRRNCGADLLSAAFDKLTEN